MNNRMIVHTLSSGLWEHTVMRALYRVNSILTGWGLKTNIIYIYIYVCVCQCTRSSLVQVMIVASVAPNLYLNQHWLIFNWTVWNLILWRSSYDKIYSKLDMIKNNSRYISQSPTINNTHSHKNTKPEWNYSIFLTKLYWGRSSTKCRTFPPGSTG